jgi:hypothetical protein
MASNGLDADGDADHVSAPSWNAAECSGKIGPQCADKIESLAEGFCAFLDRFRPYSRRSA